jgi:hypothetical protein
MYVNLHNIIDHVERQPSRNRDDENRVLAIILLYNNYII